MIQPTNDFISELFDKRVSYRVPLYQRHYVWDNINWEHLWEDIEEKAELRRKNKSKEHFTGALVIQEIAPNAVLEIIDGQQRLTTFQIIFCVIRDLCDNFCDTMDIGEQAEEYIRGKSMNPLVGEQNYDMRYKLLPREGTDRDVFLSLVEKEEVVDKENPIWKAYNHFKTTIETYVANDYEKLEILHDSIVKDFWVVTIWVAAEDEYSKIFKSINGTGRRLDQFDLLRNDLFLRASVTQREKLYRQYWHHFEEHPDWRKAGVVDDFLANFLKVKLGTDFKNQLNLFDLYESYCLKLTKELNLSETNPQLVEYEFYDLSRCSRIYRDTHTKYSERIECISFFDPFRPNDYRYVVRGDDLRLFILELTNNFGLSHCELNRVFNLFEAYVVWGMLHIGSKGHSSRELAQVFLRILRLEKKERLSLIDLVYLLSSQWPTNQEIKSALERLPKTEAKRKKSKARLMREFGGRYIFDVLGWAIDETELFEKFCEKWPPAEVILHKELKGGLPIVYSTLPVSVEVIKHLGSEQTEPQIDGYVFITYEGTTELSEYEIDDENVIGKDINSEGNELITLDLEEILFAFPTTAMTSLENYITPVDDNTKKLRLKPEFNREKFSTRNWLFDKLFNEKLALQLIEESSNHEHWLLPDIEVVVVTCAGHKLNGTLKSFSTRALYLEINSQIVTLYIHGIHTIERKNRRKT